tara:strand:+ start:52 stop:264 length:213 start_codon:yes stop_codon:yes gene_type:complete
MKLSDAILSPAVAAGIAIVAALSTILRFVFTNQKKIAVLEARYDDIKCLLKEMRDEQKELRRDVQNLARK